MKIELKIGQVKNIKYDLGEI